MTEPIRIMRTTHKKDKPEHKDLTFGAVFTDHMFIADFEEEKGWYDPRVEPYGPLSLDPVSVNYKLANSTAASGSDYVMASGTVVFAPGETVQTVAVLVLGDTRSENNETFLFNLSGAQNAAIADSHSRM